MRPVRASTASCLAAALAAAACAHGATEGNSESRGSVFDQRGLASGAALGGFTGAAAGGGAAWGVGGMILGALLGTYLGQQVVDEDGGRSQVGGPIKVGPVEICFQDACVPEEDSYRYAESTYDAFLNKPVGSETSWRNPATASHGTTTITGQYVRADGAECKEFSQHVTFKDERRQVEGAACKADDGTWKVVDIEPESASQRRTQGQSGAGRS